MNSKQEKRLDNLWSLAIRKRDNCCVICGEREGLQSAHIFVRDNRNTRWDLNNGITLCTKCHSWGHVEPNEFTRFIKNQIGIDAYKKLEQKALSIVKYQIYSEIKNSIKLGKISEF